MVGDLKKKVMGELERRGLVLPCCTALSGGFTSLRSGRRESDVVVAAEVDGGDRERWHARGRE